MRLQINHVGPVPPSYYVRDHINVDYEQCTVVKRGSSQQLDYEILSPGCVLRSVRWHECRLWKRWPESDGIRFLLPCAGGSLPQRALTSVSGCFWRRERGNGRRPPRCRKLCPARDTMLTWCPRMDRWRANSQECVSELQHPSGRNGDCRYWYFVGFSQTFWDSITLTASSKLKESASPLKCFCLTTCLVRRLLEGFKTHQLRATANQNQDDIVCVRSAAIPEHKLKNLIYIYMLSTWGI